MALSKIARNIIISIGVIFAVTAIAVPSIVVPLRNSPITLKLLDNAGIMIETKNTRIYVDPYNLDVTYADLDADIILITHPHGDHYQPSTLSLLDKEDTTYIMPENMTTQLSYHDGIGVNPGDEIEIGNIKITAFYMYTLPVETFPASHPKEANWTSYIIDVDGFTFFHAGDSKNIDEYEQLTGLVDVALLPLGPGCQTMTDMEVVNALNTIEGQYFIPIHYGEGACQTFIANYGSYIMSECQLIHLEYWETHVFEQ
ncbi:MAG: MBL fold metallo-hydrolase [Candidatus Heimdallarchaeota archaeon]|nr:MAG: MBL fold metallo-hydrolase [Candidatus Heimdallarchaeota archaeon]